MSDDGVDYRKMVAMDDSEISMFLEKSMSGVLALTKDGRPYSFPVCFAYDDTEEYIYVIFGTHENSKKIEYLEHNPQASLTVYERSPGAEIQSVILSGPMREIEDEARIEKAKKMLLSRHCTAPLYFWAVASEELDFKYYLLDIEEKSGRDSEVSWPSSVKKEIESMLEE